MDRFNEAVSRYQQKIGTYDKQLWERSVEKKVLKRLKNIQNIPKKTAKVKSELIDVDLVRGSTFPKAKPQHSWLEVTRKGLLRVFFFPIYYDWWWKQTTGWVTLFLFLLYVLQAATMMVCYANSDEGGSGETMSSAHMLTPAVMMTTLGLVHAQIVATHESHRRSGPKALFRGRKAGAKSQKKELARRKGPSEETGANHAGVKGQTLEMNGVRSQRKLTKATHNRRRSTSLAKEKLNGIDSGHARANGHDADDESDDNIFNIRVSRDGEKTSKAQGNKPHSFQEESIIPEVSQIDDLSDHGDRESVNIPPSHSEASHFNGGLPDLDLSQCHSNLNGVHNLDLSEGHNKLNGLHDLDLSEGHNNLNGVHNLDLSEGHNKLNGLHDLDLSEGQDIQDHAQLYVSDLMRRKASEDDGIISGSSMDTAESLNQPITQTVGELLSPHELGISCDTEDSKNGANLSRSGSHERDSGLFELDKPILGGTQDVGKSSSESDNSHVDQDSCDDSLTVKSQSVPSTQENCRTGCTNGPTSHTQNVLNQNGPQTKSEKNTRIGAQLCIPKILQPDEHDSKGAKRKANTRHEDMDNNHGERWPYSNGAHTQKVHPSVTNLMPGDEPMASTEISASSCGDTDRETETTTPNTPSQKRANSLAPPDNEDGFTSDVATSEIEWEDTVNTEMTSCSDSSSHGTSDSEIPSEEKDRDCSESGLHGNTSIQHVASVMKNLASSTDKVSCTIWEGEEIKKVDLTVLDVGWTIIQRVDKIPETCDYLLLGVLFSISISLMPVMFRLFYTKQVLLSLDLFAVNMASLVEVYGLIFGNSWRQHVVMVNAAIQRLFLGLFFFFLLSVAERTFKQRLLYAKHFCYLTSSRRAKKYDLPHFRLNKVRNIKTWLSLRSYLKKRGPQRSVDTIVSASFILAVCLVSVMCIELLQDSATFLEHLGNWELMMWCMALGIYLLRFMTLGTKINRKYRNFSVLITEQINLYLHMEQKPHKKEELMLANNVLKLAEDLLKELESPFKISGLSINPFLYNTTKVVILSAFSAVLTELLGFKLKLYKIKLKT